MSEQVRIKKGVRPYGGRIADVLERFNRPDGREVVVLRAPGVRRGWFTDPREYYADEVEPVVPKVLKAVSLARANRKRYQEQLVEQLIAQVDGQRLAEGAAPPSRRASSGESWSQGFNDALDEVLGILRGKL